VERFRRNLSNSENGSSKIACGMAGSDCYDYKGGRVWLEENKKKVGEKVDEVSDVTSLKGDRRGWAGCFIEAGTQGIEERGRGFMMREGGRLEVRKSISCID